MRFVNVSMYKTDASVRLTEKAQYAVDNLELHVYEDTFHSEIPNRFHIIGCIERRWIKYEQMILDLEDLAELEDPTGDL